MRRVMRKLFMDVPTWSDRKQTVQSHIGLDSFGACSFGFKKKRLYYQ